MERRTFLATGATALGLVTAGCQGLGSDEQRPQPVVLENRSELVYVPTHSEGMGMAGMAAAGRYRFALSYSTPHRFWLVTGDRVRQVTVEREERMHLMLTAWDEETGTVVPTSNAVVTVSQGEEAVVSDTSLWPMLSQNMGVHFGDNIPLDGDGSYEVTVEFGPVETRGAGALAGGLAEQVSASFELEYSEAELLDLPYEDLSTRAGEADAIEPMAMEMVPAGQASPREQLPGETVGAAATGDAVFAATSLPMPDGIDGDGRYLAVSARTPYNRYPLPFMSLSATVTRDGETVFDGDLTGTLHDELNYHYGAAVDGIQSGDTVRIAVDAPPQVARHEGYETAFVEMESVELTV